MVESVFVEVIKVFVKFKVVNFKMLKGISYIFNYFVFIVYFKFGSRFEVVWRFIGFVN